MAQRVLPTAPDLAQNDPQGPVGRPQLRSFLAPQVRAELLAQSGILEREVRPRYQSGASYMEEEGEDSTHWDPC